MSTPTEDIREQVERWRDRARSAAEQAATSAVLLENATEEDHGINAGALVSIALSLSVLAEAVVMLADDEVRPR